jgi:hypothetical protein
MVRGLKKTPYAFTVFEKCRRRLRTRLGLDTGMCETEPISQQTYLSLLRLAHVYFQLAQTSDGNIPARMENSGAPERICDSGGDIISMLRSVEE